MYGENGCDGDNMKDKSELKSKYHDIQTSVRIGKNGLSNSIIDEINGQFENRDIDALKVEVKHSGTYSSDKGREEIAEEVADRTDSRLVEVRGKKFILYKP